MHFRLLLILLWGSIAVVNAAEKPLADAIIVVDPGHGGQGYSKSYTGGTRGVKSKLTESELNLRVAVELEKRLVENGATVIVTRRGNHRLSREGSSAKDELHARIDWFEHHACHFFVSIHHNGGPPTTTGHLTIYKKNIEADSLYKSLAEEINNAFEGVMPGPKRALIKGDYHLVRETLIPGTITEAGFQTNEAFDQLSNEPDFPAIEAKALLKGTVQYWAKHHQELKVLRQKLLEQRKAKPVDPKTITAIALNETFRKQLQRRLQEIEPTLKFEPAKIAQYLEKYQQSLPGKGENDFAVTAKWDGKEIILKGNTAKKSYHDDWIDLLVGMQFYSIRNEIVLPKQE